MRHAQACNVIERAFGVLKRRFSVLTTPSEFSIQTQAEIVLACCVLHNLIRLQNDPNDDPEGDIYGNDDLDNGEPTNTTTNDTSEQTNRQRRANRKEASEFRDRLAKAMWESYSNHLLNST